MKNILRNGLIVSMLAIALVSCRDENNADDVDDLNTENRLDSDAKIKVSNDGDKVKIKTDDKKIKIKVDDDGSVKKKVKIDN